MSNKGTAVLDFGSAPGTNIATTVVTGESTILTGSVVEAYLMADSTATHNAYEHMILPITVTCGSVVAGTGFTITASSPLRLTGTFSVNWIWAEPSSVNPSLLPSLHAIMLSF